MTGKTSWRCFMDARKFHEATQAGSKSNSFNSHHSKFKIASLDLSPTRAGIALSDIDGQFALPLGVLRINNRDGKLSLLRPPSLLLEKIRTEEKNIAGWVIGWPLTLKGTTSNRTAETLQRARFLESILKIEYKRILLHDERYSTVLARADALERPGGADVGIDALAAARILQEYLDFVAMVPHGHSNA